MRLIKPSFLIKEQEPGLVGIYKQIEWAGRHCYKSHDKITEGSAERFVNAMIKSGHHSVLEHGTVYLLYSESCYSYPTYKQCSDFVQKYYDNPYSKVTYLGLDDDNLGTSDNPKYRGDILGVGVYGDLIYAISTNFRVLIENNWLDDLKYLCEPTEWHEKRYTVRFICDRAVSHQLVRSRSMSFAQESQRYCNYSKSKYNGEITFIEPNDYNNWSNGEKLTFEGTLIVCEDAYLSLLERLKPEQARALLPNATKTEIVVTGFASDWGHFFRLRTSIIAETGRPHPDASELADPLYKEFLSRGYMESLV